MAQQIDLGPNNPTGLHIHVPAGLSASAANNPSDFPSVPASTGGKSVTAKIAPANGGPRFANPA